MSDLGPGDVLERSRAALWRVLDDAVVVLGPDADKPRVVTGPGARLWQLAARPITIGDLVADLAAAHDASVDVVRADVGPVLDVLVRDGALERRS